MFCLMCPTDLPPPATRERPPGCKTVFVGGLPENATEQIISEVFEQCGAISAIRKSKKNFCHIRFAEEHTVDKALFLSGTHPQMVSFFSFPTNCFNFSGAVVLIRSVVHRSLHSGALITSRSLCLLPKVLESFTQLIGNVCIRTAVTHRHLFLPLTQIRV